MKDFYCVKNDTWCIDTGRTLIGVYRLNDNDVILLDSGTSYGGAETKKLMAVVEGADLRVKAVIATHGHLDHIGNNENLIKMFDTKVYMYGAEAYMCSDMDSLRMQHSLVPFDETIEKALKCMKSRVDVFIDPHVRSVDICGRKFGIIHTPGHSMSHISIITPDNIGMLGDALMTENEIVKTKIPYASNFAVDFASKRKLPELNCDRYIISHRGVRSGWELEREVEANINYLKTRADVVLSYIEDGMCFDDIAAAVVTCMNIKISNRYYFFDIHGMIMPYVQYLEESGKVETYYEKGYIRYRVTDHLGEN